MAYEQKNNTGTLFKNDRKEKETHPDWKGSITIKGQQYWISAWDKSGQKGPFFSLSVQEKDLNKPAKKTNQHAEPYRPHDTEEVPF